ncbi:hypothetical protein JST56_04770 [Candidatus Dependentiae bacterium]|nr:hypothetical protein [Candidatus Dependentiae bacterium]
MLTLFIFLLYQFVQLFILPIVIPYTFITQINAQEVCALVKEQSGFVPQTDSSQHVVWIHGLNAGEILSIQALVEKIKHEIPGSACYITSSTQEGKNIAEKTIKADYVSMLPHDNIASMSLAFARINPTAIIALEHEVWPTMVMYAHMKNIPIYLLNAQMTSCTAKNLQNNNPLYHNLFSNFSEIFAQSMQDKKLFEEAGIASHMVTSLGNIKAFNVMPKKESLLLGHADKLEQFNKEKQSTIMLVGSVHKGEVDHYLNVFTTLKKDNPSLKLILAPRFKDWHDELIQKVTLTKLPFFIWSDGSLKISNLSELISELGEKVLVDNDIVVVNTFGTLFMLSSIADLYFPGGTFVPVGGHNVLEPAAWGNPMIIGPHDENTREIVNLLAEQQAIIKVQTPEELFEQTEALLKNQKKRRKLGNHALTWITHEAVYVEAGLEKVVSLIQDTITHNLQEYA